jgi:arogenate dehydrogenase (NADP+)
VKIGIVGLGLIGGSLALDFRALGWEVYGVSRQESTCDFAVQQGIVNQASRDLSLLGNAEVIFICTPISLIIPTLEQLLPHLSEDTIVTDVGSVKTSIVSACSRLWPRFVGGHPMAGKAEQGIAAAQAQLFQSAPYVLTPQGDTDSQAQDTLAGLIDLLGARFYSCTPAAHDQAVAWISHLPVIISSSLIQACYRETDREILQLAQNLASSGFRDTSRVGGGNPELGVMMATYNREALLHSLGEYRQCLEEVIALIAEENWDALAVILQRSQADRPNFLNT